MSHKKILKSKIAKIKQFNPDDVGTYNGKLYGLPFDEDESEVIVIPVPWEATVSFRSGTADAPKAILNASPQLDLYDSAIDEAWQLGIAMLPIPEEWIDLNYISREKARACIKIMEHGGDPNNQSVKMMSQSVNDACKKVHQWVYETSKEWLTKNKIVAVLGGDHSVTLGLVRSLSEKYDEIGILQIDAHADLRVDYQGFEFSHASIMNNVLKFEAVTKLVQVGIRDYCKTEADRIKSSQGRIKLYENRILRDLLYQGLSWHEISTQIINELPQNVYISFDIDGLDPSLCPNTGTPVPGGLSYNEAIYVIEQIVKSGRNIIGFDLCEVASDGEKDSWDANVGARLLYQLSNFSALSFNLFSNMKIESKSK